MNPIITPFLLASTGIKIPEAQLEEYLAHMNDQLAERVGESVVEFLEEDQLEELATLQETETDEKINTWLREKVPELDAMIQQEVDILLGDAVENSATINSLPEN